MKPIRKKKLVFFSWNLLYFFITVFYMVYIVILVLGSCGDENCRCICSRIILYTYFYHRRLQEDIYSHKTHLKLIYIGFMNMFSLTSPSLYWFCFSSGQIINFNIYLECYGIWSYVNIVCKGDIQSWFCDMMSNWFINHLIDQHHELWIILIIG